MGRPGSVARVTQRSPEGKRSPRSGGRGCRGRGAPRPVSPDPRRIVIPAKREPTPSPPFRATLPTFMRRQESCPNDGAQAPEQPRIGAVGKSAPPEPSVRPPTIPRIRPHPPSSLVRARTGCSRITDSGLSPRSCTRRMTKSALTASSDTTQPLTSAILRSRAARRREERSRRAPSPVRRMGSLFASRLAAWRWMGRPLAYTPRNACQGAFGATRPTSRRVAPSRRGLIRRGACG